MESVSSEEVKKHVRTYVVVFVALLALTVITVAISTFHLGTTAAIIVALCIAGLKASLVAGYFMHLLSEKKLIYAALALTAVLFIVLMTLPILHLSDRGI